MEARWGQTNTWYKAKIRRCNDDGTYDIRYDDGDKEEFVERHCIRPRGQGVARAADSTHARLGSVEEPIFQTFSHGSRSMSAELWMGWTGMDGINDGVGAARNAGQQLEQEADKNFVPLTIDATYRGNVARFLNHACSPSNNLCKQKVFAAPYVTAAYRLAFFAARDIELGEELTYDYGYEVGAVKGQPVVCQCGAPACRGRLL
jgi:hypothetical protein